MRFVLDDGGGETELVATVRDGSATMADLLRAAGREPPAWVTVDGRAVATDHTLVEAAVPDGATIAFGGPPDDLLVVDPPLPRWRLTVVAGTAAGIEVPLDRAVTVGRDLGCELRLASMTVSGRHCRVVDDGRGGVTITDLGSTNGTWVGGEVLPSGRSRTVVSGALVRCGAVALRLEEVVDDVRPRSVDPLRHLTSDGTVPFNRPPRPPAPPPTPAIEPVPDPPSPAEPPGFPLAAIAAPAVVGLVMVVVLGDPRYALFVLLSPLVLVATVLGDRRRTTRDRRRAAAAHRDAVARFVDAVVATRACETARRWELTPSIAEVCRRGRAPSTRLWERRPGHDDHLLLTAGVGAVPHRPPLADADGRTVAPGLIAREILDAADRLHDAPVPVDLSGGGVVGIVGDRTAALALARSLVVQAVVHHGPADLRLAAAVATDAVGPWSWLPWLPHAAGEDPGVRRLAVGATDGSAMLRGLLDDEGARRAEGRAAARAQTTPGRDEVDGRPTTLVVLDAPAVLRGREAPARAVLRGDAGPVAGIVVAPTAEQLPAVCDTVVRCLSADGDAVLVRPGERLQVGDLLVAGLPEEAARLVARRLAGLDDPEVVTAGGRLPALVDLLDLLDLGAAPTADALARSWSSRAGDPGLSAPVGVGGHGPVRLELTTDGPHGLLGGTTGSGKSELLRSLVAGLAARYGPDHLTFVLVDYKGGAAFDACAGLPHVVGLVTDLDEHLGERALRCLEAELGHRERRLRAAGVSDLPAWLRLPVGDRGDPLPRLVVVIDEFATLKAELPGFVDALVGIAQRGRSLGVHLLLGTQRPSGAVDENVRANSNLRIALRVTDAHDSTDVVGVPDAAAIPPTRPGRGILRVGPASVVPLQTALVTGRGRGHVGAPVEVAPLRFAVSSDAADVGPAATPPDHGPTDLERIVAAARAAAAAGGAPPPRRPWPDPLPDLLTPAVLAAAQRGAASRGRGDLDPRVDRSDGDDVGSLAAGPWSVAGETATDVGHAATGRATAPVVPIALVDLPDRQAQVPTGWRLDAGPLLLHGVVGSGTTTTLASAVLAACRASAPDDLHVHVLDMGRGDLAPLARIPHVGAVVTGRELERRRRLLGLWLTEADRRRRATAAELARMPWLVVAIDGLDALLAELDDPSDFEVVDGLLRLLTEAAGLRIASVLVAARGAAARSQLLGAVEQRWTHRLASPDEYAMLGIRPADVPTMVPGRALRIADGRTLQVVHPGDLRSAAAAVAGMWPRPATNSPRQVRVLPTRVAAEELVGSVEAPVRGVWRLPVGRRDRDLALAALPLHAGEHAVLLGPPGSGRSGVLGAVARGAAVGGVEVVVAAGSSTSPLLADGHEVVAHDRLAARLAGGPSVDGRLLVVVDDADRVADPGVVLESLARDGPRVHLVVAARDTTVQAEYGHWVRRLARTGVGAFLRPLGGVQGDLLGTRVPVRAPTVVTPGRGWVVAPGAVDFVQFATVDDAASARA